MLLHVPPTTCPSLAQLSNRPPWVTLSLTHTHPHTPTQTHTDTHTSTGTFMFEILIQKSESSDTTPALQRSPPCPCTWRRVREPRHYRRRRLKGVPEVDGAHRCETIPKSDQMELWGPSRHSREALTHTRTGARALTVLPRRRTITTSSLAILGSTTSHRITTLTERPSNRLAAIWLRLGTPLMFVVSETYVSRLKRSKLSGFFFCGGHVPGKRCYKPVDWCAHTATRYANAPHNWTHKQKKEEEIN